MYRRQGTKLLHNGRAVKLNAVNVIGMELPNAVIFGLWANRTVGDMLDDIKRCGFNCLRLPITHNTINNVPLTESNLGAWAGGVNRALLGKRSMEMCDLLIEECEKRGLRYIFDVHYLRPDGTIPDLWYDGEYTENVWLSDIYLLANRYNGKPGFVGIDTKNEPNSRTATWGTGDSRTDWRLASNKAHRKIREVNQAIISIVETIQTSMQPMFDKPLDVPLEEYVESPHWYGPDVWGPYTHDFDLKPKAMKPRDVNDRSVPIRYRAPPPPTELFHLKAAFGASPFPNNMPDIWRGYLGSAYKTRYVFIGEWGGKQTPGSKDRQWAETLSTFLRDNDIDGGYWGMGADSGHDTGGIYSGGDYKSIRDDKVQLIKKLVTSETTFTTDQVTPIPSPVPTPSPTPSPVPGKFKQYDLVKMKTSDSPVFMIESILAGGSLRLIYWNSARGEIAKAEAEPYLFSLVVQK